MAREGGEPEEVFGEDEPVRPPLPPDDRVWRHPSELGARGLPRSYHSVSRRRQSRALVAGGTVLVVLVVVLAGSRLVGFGSPAGAPRLTAADQTTTTLSSSTTVLVSQSMTNVIDQISGAVVLVRVLSPAGTTEGSGLVVQSDGVILTSAALVAGAMALTVVLSDGAIFAGHVVGTDAVVGLSLVQVDANGLPTASFDTGDTPVAGQLTMALSAGLPNGRQSLLSVGSVVSVGEPLVQSQGTLIDTIETDAPLASTGEGGALVDDAGGVIGILLLQVPDGNDPVSVAAPAVLAEQDVAELGRTGRAQHAWLGISGITASTVSAPAGDPATAGPADTSADSEQQQAAGVEVVGVTPGGPASQAGIRPGDFIEGVGGQQTPTAPMLQQTVQLLQPGMTVRVSLDRGGRILQVPVRLGSSAAFGPETASAEGTDYQPASSMAG